MESLDGGRSEACLYRDIISRRFKKDLYKYNALIVLISLN